MDSSSRDSSNDQPQPHSVDPGDDIAMSFESIKSHLIAFQQLVLNAVAWGQSELTHVRLIDQDHSVLDLSDFVAIDMPQDMIERVRFFTAKREVIAAMWAIPHAPGGGRPAAIDICVELPGLVEATSRAPLTLDGFGPFGEWTFDSLGPYAWVVLPANYVAWAAEYNADECVAPISSVDLDVARDRAAGLALS